MTQRDRGAIAFGEKLLNLLDEGSFTATYKFAVLLGLLDLCLEHTDRTGAAPESVTTGQLATKVVELYWPHTTPFPTGNQALVLRQNTGGQAEIVTLIRRFRERLGPEVVTPAEARTADRAGFERLVERIEWKLVEMPLPKLQRMGQVYDPFIYQIGWDDQIRRSELSDAGFDNRITFVAGASDHLVRLGGLLRPLVQRQWTAMVSRLNRELSEEARLEQFLFGAQRVPLERVRPALRELQENRCFYCGERFRAGVDVDHFIPWARYPDNSLANLVAADGRCNNAKRHFLAAPGHVARWTQRVRDPRPLADVARAVNWEWDPDRTLSVARAIYLRLPAEAKLWLRGRDFVDADPASLERALLPGGGRSFA